MRKNVGRRNHDGSRRGRQKGLRGKWGGKRSCRETRKERIVKTQARICTVRQRGLYAHYISYPRYASCKANDTNQNTPLLTHHKSGISGPASRRHAIHAKSFPTHRPTSCDTNQDASQLTHHLSRIIYPASRRHARKFTRILPLVTRQA